jgi:hypothetical protein
MTFAGQDWNFLGFASPASFLRRSGVQKFAEYRIVRGFFRSLLRVLYPAFGRAA